MFNKPFSEACARNQGPILAALHPWLAHTQAVLEIGSGTGQHAVYFAEQLPHLTWYASDQEGALDGLQAWINDAQLPNLRGPLALEVCQPWPHLTVDAVFSANTLHIMGWREVAALFQGAAQLLPVGGQLWVYGPFNHQGQYTSPGNAELDVWVKARFPTGGLKDEVEIAELSRQAGFSPMQRIPMPANNLLCGWLRGGLHPPTKK
jgi:cyclopropane fatty-acyl-phospholipid synthase-like methyltransferase